MGRAATVKMLYTMRTIVKVFSNEKVYSGNNVAPPHLPGNVMGGNAKKRGEGDVPKKCFPNNLKIILKKHLNLFLVNSFMETFLHTFLIV